MEDNRYRKREDAGYDPQQGPWWNSLPARQPEPEPVPQPMDYSDEGGGFSAGKIIAIVLAVVAAIAVIGGGAAFALSHQPPDEDTGITQEAEDAAKQASSVYLTVFADGTGDGSSSAVISVLKGTDGNDVAKVVNAKAGDHTDLGMLDAGQYRLHVDSVPVNADGSTYLTPLFDMQFEVVGDGKDVELTLNLDSASADEATGNETQEEGTESQEQAQQPADAATQPADTGSVPVAGSSSAPAQSQPAGSTQGHQHSWVAITQTKHHDAVYRTVNHPEQKERRTICDTCGQDVTGNFAAHRSASGHTSTHYEYKVIRQAYTEQVLVSAAYDETVTTGYRCSVCGATK